MNDMDLEKWRGIGRRLGDARRSLLLSKRAAAKRAGFSEGVWRELEAGERQIGRGTRVPPSPRDSTLEAAALAVGLEPAEMFAMAGRPYEGSRRGALELVPRGDLALEARLMLVEQQIARLHTRVDYLVVLMGRMERGVPSPGTPPSELRDGR